MTRWPLVSDPCRLIAAAIVAMFAFNAAVARATDDAARFDTPEAAVQALTAALKSAEKGGLARIFGSALRELQSGDDVQDQAAVAQFAQRLAEAQRLDKNADGTMTLYIGRVGHPFAIPLAQKDGKWYFDTAAGKEEILNRRIGDNELRTLAVCRGYVVAQREYAEVDRDGDDVIEYAQRFASTPGRQDGLYWESAEGQPPSPLGPLVAEARGAGYAHDKAAADAGPRPYHGYVYKILSRQGEHAPGGKFDYVINGNMVAGFALVARPVKYGESGVMTFIVNANGKVLEKDLGEKTEELVAAMDAYDAGDGWKPSED